MNKALSKLDRCFEDYFMEKNKAKNLYPHQKEAVTRIMATLNEKSAENKLGVVRIANGVGKTIVIAETISAIMSEYPGKWAYLVLTSRIDSEQNLVGILNGYFQVKNVKSRADMNRCCWQPNDVVVSTMQKFFPSFNAGKYYQDNNIIVDTRVLIIIEETIHFTRGVYFESVLKCFANAYILGFSSFNLENSDERHRFGNDIFNFSYVDAVEAGLTLPVYLQSVANNPVDGTFIIEHFANRNKALVICRSIEEAQRYYELLEKSLNADVFFHTSNPKFRYKADTITTFVQSRRAVLFVARFPIGINAPELDTIYWIDPIKIQQGPLIFAQMLSAVSRSGNKKRNGEIVAFNLSRSIVKLAEQFCEPGVRFIDGTKGDKAESILSFDEIIKNFNQMLQNNDYKPAFLFLEKLQEADYERYEELISELSFLFDTEKSLEENQHNWQRYSEIIAYKVDLWLLLSGGKTEIPKLKETVDFDKSIEPAPVYTEKKEHSQVIGARFEMNVFKLLRELFDISTEDEIILDSLRRQLGGKQNGFDIQFTYNDSVGSLCTCVMECKKINEIKLQNFSHKLLELRDTNRTVHHWILIAPHAKVENTLNSMLEKWDKENFWYPIQKVQIWTPENFVENFFGLVPEVYNYYYPNGTLQPERWDEEKRSSIAKIWKQKVRPAVCLPVFWTDYLRNPDRMLTLFENDSQCIRNYDDLYPRRVNIPCLDEAGNHIAESTEQYIMEWLYREDSSALFLLGEFGDGKTFLTYSLSRRLSDDFLESPETGYVPIRLTLCNLKASDGPQAFLKNRLESIGAEFSDWSDVKSKYKILIILDGFDEMSTGMDLKSIEANSRLLYEGLKLFQGMKLIVTSRSPVFKMIKTSLLERIDKSETIYLAPINNSKKMFHLSEYAKEHNCQERLNKLQAVHDVIGLASKALYLDMVKATMLDGEITEVDSLTIYDSYIKSTLSRKADIQFERDDYMVSRRRVLNQLELMMEEFALISYKNGGTTDFTLESFKAYQEEPELAKRLWADLTSCTPKDNEDTDNRLINRSLLKVSGKIHAFCHRSIQEYFVAKGICRLICDDLYKAENFLSGTNLSYEVIGFAGKILFRLTKSKAKIAKKNLMYMIEKTRLSHEDIGLASIAVNLYYSAWSELPGKAWNDLILDNVCLPEADLSRKNFSGTSMKYANLDNVNFTNANLSDCDLTGVRFDETKELYSIKAVTEDKLYVYSLYSDGNLLKWDIYNNTCTKSAKLHFDAGFNIKNSGFGLVLSGTEKLYFTNKTINGTEICGGISYSDDTTVLDICENTILFLKHDEVFFYDLKNRSYIFSSYPVEGKIRAIIIDKFSIFLYGEKMGVQLLSKVENDILKEELDEKFTIRRITNITAASVFLKDAKTDLSRLCVGYNNGDIEIYEFSNKKMKETIRIVKDYACRQYIRNLCFLNYENIIYSGLDGIIYNMEINEFTEIAQYRLSVKCNGANISGVKPQEQYEKLKFYQSNG